MHRSPGGCLASVPPGCAPLADLRGQVRAYGAQLPADTQPVYAGTRNTVRHLASNLVDHENPEPPGHLAVAERGIFPARRPLFTRRQVGM